MASKFETAAPSFSASRSAPAQVGGWTFASAYTLGFLTLIYAFNTADRNIFGLLMPLIQAEMHLSDTALGFMSGFAFALFYALAGIPVAYLADRWSRRTIIAIGFATWSLMTVLTGFVQNAVQMALARFMLGAGEAAGLAPSNSMIGDLFDKPRRTLALSILQSANSIGILVAFPIIGWIAQHHGWRDAFIAAGLPGLFLAALFYFSVKEPQRGQTDAKPDVAAPVAFLPTISKLLRTRSYVLIVTASVFIGVALWGVQTWLPTYLMRVRDLPPQEVGGYIGFIRGPAGICGAVFGGLATNLLARRDERWLIWAPAIFMFMITASDFLMLYSDSDVGWKVGMAFDTFFSSAQVGPVFAILLATADARSRAMATAVTLLILHLVGLTGGPLLVGALNDALRPALGEEAIRTSLTVATLSAVAAGFCCLAVGRLERDSPRS